MEKYFYFMECVTKTKEGLYTPRKPDSYVTTKSSLVEAKKEWYEKLTEPKPFLIRFGIFYLIAYTKGQKTAKRIYFVDDRNENQEASKARVEKSLKEEDGTFEITEFSRIEEVDKDYISTLFSHFDLSDDMNQDTFSLIFGNSLEKNTQDQLNEILRNLGFNDPYLFIKLMLGVYLQTQINELNTKIKGFEQKYECFFEDFQARFHEMKQFSMFEKEDDGMNWESYLVFYADYEKLLKQL